MKNNKGYCKQAFVWEVEADKSLMFLNSIVNFCIVKSKQTETGIMYRNTMNMYNGRRGLSLEEKEKRKMFIDNMKNINHSVCEEYVKNILEYPNNSTEHFFQYLAGFFDAEGCIYIHKGSYVLRVFISQTNIHILNLIQNYFGGKIRKVKNKLRADGCNRKQAWVWELTSRNTIYFMECIKPYLLEKKEQAELAIKYQKHDLIIHTTKIPYEEIKKREEYRLNLIILKKTHETN